MVTTNNYINMVYLFLQYKFMYKSLLLKKQYNNYKKGGATYYPYTR